MDEKEFQINQPLLYKHLNNVIKNDKVSQAYLLWGDSRCNFQEIGKFMVQSLLCDKKGIACGKCSSCLRFLDNKSPSFVMIQNSNKLISKDQINELKKYFELTPIENNKRMCYLIMDCQNLKNEAANALLKFLEEPNDKVTAILTTPNKENVLPTIVSRCETIQLKSIDRVDIYNYLIGKGYSSEVSYFLSDYSGDKDLLVSLADNKDYIDMIDKLNNFILDFSIDKIKSTYTLLGIANQKVKSTQNYFWFYNGFSRFIVDCLTKSCSFGPYAKYISSFDIKDRILYIKIKNYLEKIIKTSGANISFIGVSGYISNLIIEDNDGK